MTDTTANLALPYIMAAQAQSISRTTKRSARSIVSRHLKQLRHRTLVAHAAGGRSSF